MENATHQKLKLLYIMEILRHSTDESNPLLGRDLIAELGKKGVKCSLRTLTEDIALLNAAGFEIMDRFIGHEKAYYIEDRSFSVPELKIMIDAVQAASFITESKTRDLSSKIAALGGMHQARIMTENIVSFNKRKHSNESIYYNISELESAIVGHMKVSFYYYDLDANRNKVYRRNHDRYLADPAALVFHEDNYYLLAYELYHEGIVAFRTDRMESVKTEGPASAQIPESTDVSGYTKESFKMFGGEEKTVTLQFSNSLLGVLYDKFGEDLVVSQYDERSMVTNVKVMVSPMFYGFVFSFGADMKILSPKSVADEFEQMKRS